MRKWTRILLFICLAVVFSIPPAAAGQEGPDWHPKVKEVWGDFKDWKLISPGEQMLQTGKLHNLRVVYDRETGLNTDDPSKLKASYQFHEAVWDGKPAFVVIWMGLGDVVKQNQEAQIVATVNEAGTYRSLLNLSGWQGESWAYDWVGEALCDGAVGVGVSATAAATTATVRA